MDEGEAFFGLLGFVQFGEVFFFSLANEAVVEAAWPAALHPFGTIIIYS